MTPRERFIAALERRPITGRVPHFELVFFLTMEAFGRVHPIHRHYAQWDQMEEKERELHRRDMADLYIRTAERFEHDAIFIHQNPDTVEEACRLIDIIRERTGDRYFLMMHGDATFAIPDGERLSEFCYRIADDAEAVHAEARALVEQWVAKAEALQRARRAGWIRALFGLLLQRRAVPQSGDVRRIHHALPEGTHCTLSGHGILHHQAYGRRHPSDPGPACRNGSACTPLDRSAGGGGYRGGEEAVRRIRICLIGNVNCGLLQSGTPDEIRENVRYALRHGMPGGGYIFSTSNCVYTGLPLERYEIMLETWRTEGNY